MITTNNIAETGDYTRYATPPPYATADATQALAAVKHACATAITVAEELASATKQPDWDNLVVPMDAAMERIDREYSLVAHLHVVAADAAWNKANLTCRAAVTEAMSAIGQHAGLHARYQALAKAGAPAVPNDRVRILRDTLAEFKFAGVGLAATQRKEFTANEQRLAEISVLFDEHVREDTEAWQELVTDETSLGEMPADMRATARVDDSWQISLLDPSYFAYMAHGTDRGLRERLILARNARASDLGTNKTRDNLPLVRETMALRWQQARLLGFQDPASMILSRRMAKDADTVAIFLAKLGETARLPAQQEIAQLREFATSLGINHLQPWDTPFIVEQYKQATTALAESEVRPYFGINKVLDGLFACAGKLFDLRFAPIELSVWAPAVRTFTVSDGAGNTLGTMYLDLQARPNKRGGAWAHGAMARCVNPAGKQLPIALVNCNFSPAATGAEARLGWQEVVVLFHETGHALHHLLGKVNDFCASGMNGVEWDAVELPSQFLENFSWQPEVARGLSAHLDTGTPLPAEMFAKLEKQRTFLPGLFVTRQLAFASYDLELHRTYTADPLVLWEQIASANLVTPRLDNDRTPCAFSHIFAGGYAAGYYGYLWADVLAADAYEMFSKPGADQVQLGRHFATEVLERGGSRDADDNFRALRGREPDSAALLRRLGLT